MTAAGMAPPPAAAAAEPFPTPVFEGSEKRIEIDFAHAPGADTAANGLRSMARPQLDAILDMAACCIVSARHGKDFDAYVLSESSLFVYGRKAILKTCGTTKLLAAVPALIDAASAAGLEPCRAKYSRASYLFPEQQVGVCICCLGCCGFSQGGCDTHCSRLEAQANWQPTGGLRLAASLASAALVSCSMHILMHILIPLLTQF